MKKVTGQSVIKPRYKPAHTPISAMLIDQAIIEEIVFPKYRAVEDGNVSKMKTKSEPTICEPIETAIAKAIKKITPIKPVLMP